MASSVTIDDNLRIQIKKLAAEFDTTQGEIIRQAIEIFMRSKFTNMEKVNPKSREIIKKNIENIVRKPWKNNIREKLMTPGIDISDLRIQLNEI